VTAAQECVKSLEVRYSAAGYEIEREEEHKMQNKNPKVMHKKLDVLVER